MERAVWIVHGDAQARTALARMAGVPALSGPPQLGAFPPAPAPGAVVLHVPLAPSETLAFAHAAAARHPRAEWLLVADPGLSPEWLRAAFAGLRASVLPFALQPAALAQAVRRALAGGAPPIGARRQRDALVARFARTLGDLAIPEPVLDASGRLAVSGERGTGKLLLARTLHALWDTAEDEGRAGFVLLAGDAGADSARLEARIAAAAERAERLVICLEDPAAFAPEVQREIAGWVELGPPAAAIDPTRLLWVFLRPESFGSVAPLDDALDELCASPALRIPPLRERPGAALGFAEQWLREWAAAQARPLRALAPSARDAIDADPWPGNARELEAALRRAVATPGDAPIEADALGLSAAGAAVPEPLRAAAEAVPTAGDARDFASVIEELDAARGAESAAAPAAPQAAPAPSADLRAFARSAARELAPALDALRARGDEPAAARLARRLARLEAYAALEPDPAARSEVAPLLAALIAERRAELLARRLLVLRELESEDTLARGSEPVLRFALGAVLDALLEAAPVRADLYVSARPTLDREQPVVRAELRLGGAAIAEDALDLTLARDVLARSGAALAITASGDETRVRVDFAR